MEGTDISAELTGQVEAKTFTIAISLAFQPNIRWNERLDNPLGLKVIRYVVENGGSDPLNPLGISAGN